MSFFQKRHFSQNLPRLAGLFLLFGLFSLPRFGRASDASYSYYLPVVMSPDPILHDTPIWPQVGVPLTHQVALFRHSFLVSEPLSEAELHLFADTRYEVWLDGKWIGRGPARFSLTWREYDILPLGDLPAGEHQVAALVQWAPNKRRSESVAPGLLGHLQGKLGGQIIIADRTSTQWKSMISTAWNAHAALVHAWKLIGPTELLDFSRLPEDWQNPSFIDETWLLSAFQPTFSPSSPPVKYKPRSIEALVEVEMPLTALDAGDLSPGFRFGELTAPFLNPASFLVTAQQPVELIVETLSDNLLPSSVVRIDQKIVPLTPVGANRPDVARALKTINPGNHQISLVNFSPSGATFSISTAGLGPIVIPFSQADHAGRRLLLAEPVSSPGRVTAVEGAEGWELTFSTPQTYLLLDLGRTVHGRLTGEISGPAGAVVDIGWDERLHSPSGRPLPYPGLLHPEWNQVDSWRLDGNKRRLSTLDARAGRYILIAVWGGAPVKLESLRVMEERYPLEQVGSFHSSDPLLNQIWQVGVDSLFPNMTDASTDTPWRERGGWWGDFYTSDRIAQAAFNNRTLMRRGLVFMAEAMRFDPSPGMAPNNNGLHMLDYTMLWVQNLEGYAETTGSWDLTAELYPLMKAFMDHLSGYENPQTGLLDLPKADWYLTDYLDTLADDDRAGQSTALNALYYRTLGSAQRIAQELGDETAANAWGLKALKVGQSVNTVLFIPAEGRYHASIFSGIPSAPTLYAQAWPLAVGLAPEGEKSRVADALLELIGEDPLHANVGTYGMNWVLEGLGNAGYVGEALELIRLYYGSMLDRGAKTWWEYFTALNEPHSSLSHGWGGSPTWFLSEYLLGLRQTSPDVWEAKPALEGVDFAEGSIPLENGLLKMRWERPDCSAFSVEIDASPGSSGRLHLPADLNYLSLNFDGVRQPNFTVDSAVDLPGGRHQINGLTACEK